MKLLPVFVGLVAAWAGMSAMPNCEIPVAELLKYDGPERLYVLKEMFSSLVFVESF